MLNTGIESKYGIINDVSQGQDLLYPFYFCIIKTWKKTAAVGQSVALLASTSQVPGKFPV